MPTVAIRELELYYEEHGRPDGEPLVLLHPFTKPGRPAWEPLFEALGRQYRLIVPDQRGHGRTNNPDGQFVLTDLARDIATLAEEIGLQRVHVCGASLGATVALVLAIEHPHLVHTATLGPGFYTFAGEERVRIIAEFLAYFRSADALAEVQEQNGWTSVERAVDLLNQWDACWRRPGELAFTADDLRAVRCPTLIAYGDRDPVCPLDDALTMYRSIPKAELCVCPNTAHGVRVESPVIYTTALLDFLGRHPMTPAA